MNVGDVLRVTKWRTEGQDHTRGRPLWAVVTFVGSDADCRVEWLEHGPYNVPQDYCDDIVAWGQNQEGWRDEFEIVPPEKWPERICVIMAKRGLGAD